MNRLELSTIEKILLNAEKNEATFDMEGHSDDTFNRGYQCAVIGMANYLLGEIDSEFFEYGAKNGN